MNEQIPIKLKEQIHKHTKQCNYKTCIFKWYEKYIENLEHAMSRMKFDDRELGWG